MSISPRVRRLGVWSTLVLGLGAAELALFYWLHDDVVQLAKPTATLLSDDRFPDAARAILAREEVTRRILERVADVAGQRGEPALRIDALERIAVTAPEDPDIRVRLADALRQSGRLAEAEQIYLSEIRRPVQ